MEQTRGHNILALLSAALVVVILLASCGISEGEARQLAEEQVQSALSALPTPTQSPPPTATPHPPSAPMPTPTPLSLPGLALLIQGVSSTAVIPVVDTIALSLTPGNPLAGRDIAFTLSGLSPWTSVTIEHIDPRGQTMDWVRPDEMLFGPSETQKTLFADASGTLTWARIASKDGEGVWSLRLTALLMSVIRCSRCNAQRTQAWNYADIRVQHRTSSTRSVSIPL